MGYCITIGNAVLNASFNSRDSDEPFAKWDVKKKTLKRAPKFPDSGQSNTRTPSYTAWAEFSRAVGLNDFFFSAHTGKMRRHPGCQRLTKADLATVEAALSRYREGSQQDPAADQHLVRLRWLAWWVRYAVEKCKRPAIANG